MKDNKPIKYIVQKLVYYIDSQCFSAQKRIKNSKKIPPTLIEGRIGY